MRLTRAGDYAVRVMMHLATAPPGAVVLRRCIQARQEVPPAHLAKIIQALGRARLLRTYRGAGGGVALAVTPDRVTVRQVIEAVEGPIILNRCLARPGACPRDSFCHAHPMWHRIQAVLVRELEAVTIAALTAGKWSGSGAAAREEKAG